MKNVQILKLISGDEVMARVQVKSGLYTLTMPVTIVQDENNLGFEPFMPYSASETFDIRKENVMYTCPPTAALADHYLKSTTPLDMSSHSEIIV